MISQETLNLIKKELQVGNPAEYPREEKRLLAMFDDLVGPLQESGCIVAGGAITSLFTNQEVNDLDVYFRDEESFSKFLCNVFSRQYGFKTVVFMTDRSILLTDHSDAKMQLIVYKFFKEVEDVFNDFDFSVNMGAYDFRTNRFVLSPNFLKHNAQKYIEINTNTAYPLVSVLRVDKYRQRGYVVSKPQMLKLLFRVTQLDFTGWDDVVDHVGGMYGIDPEKIFDRSKPFSLEEVMDQLGNLETVDGSWRPQQLGPGEVGVKFNHLLTPLAKEVFGKYNGRDADVFIFDTEEK